MLALTILINFTLFVVTLTTALITIWYTRREQWITVYLEYSKRFTEIRSQFSDDILSDSFDVKNLKNKEIRKYMREYFLLCSEEFFLITKKKWLGKKLWNELLNATRFYMSKQAFREAWREMRKEPYYDDFVTFMDELATCKVEQGY